MRKGNCSDLDKLFYFLSKTWSFQLPTSGSRAEARSRKTWKYPLTEERRTEKKGKVRKSLANQSKVNFLFSFPSLAARSRSVGVQGTHSTSPVPT